jgi:hypothetical protein
MVDGVVPGDALGLPVAAGNDGMAPIFQARSASEGIPRLRFGLEASSANNSRTEQSNSSSGNSLGPRWSSVLDNPQD